MASPTTKADNLTTREREVLTLIAAGESTKELAFTLGIAFKTAACHRTHVLEKLGARNTAYAISQATVLGLLESPPTIVPPGEWAAEQDTRSACIPSWQGLEDCRAASRRLAEALKRALTLHVELYETCYDLRSVLEESKSRCLAASVERQGKGGQA